MSNASTIVEVEPSLAMLEDEIRNTLVTNEEIITLSLEYRNFEALAAHLAREIVTEWVGNVRGDG